MALTPGMQALAPWWGTIQAAVAQSASTAELWASVRDAAAAEGVTISGANAADMSRLRGIAAEQRSALQTFSSASNEAGIDQSMIARDLNSRDITQQALSPSFVARFEWTSLVNGAE